MQAFNELRHAARDRRDKLTVASTNRRSNKSPGWNKT
jgi:hypothetical protein